LLPPGEELPCGLYAESDTDCDGAKPVSEIREIERNLEDEIKILLFYKLFYAINLFDIKASIS